MNASKPRTLLFFAATWVLSYTPAARADDLMNRVAGVWTTFNVRSVTGFTNWKAEITTAGTYSEENDFGVYLPLFQKEGMTLKIVAKQMQAARNGDLPDAITLTGKIDGVFFKFKSAKSVFENNTKNYCGFSDWQVGVYRDITGKNCKDKPDDDDQYMPARGDEMEKVFAFKDNLVYTDLGFDESTPFDPAPDTPDDPDQIEIDWKHPIYHPFQP